MKMNRVTMVTLGVADLARATEFYTEVFSLAPNLDNEGVTFFELPGTWMGLYPLDQLAEDISPEVKPIRSGFSGITLAHNARSQEDVLAIFGRALAAGATAMKTPQPTFWGGFSGYFADPDGYYWEIAWGPMFDFDEHGDMHTRK